MVLFIVGLFAPFLSVKRFIYFSNTVSLYDTLLTLFSVGEYMLLGVVLLFSALLPACKIFIEGFLWHVSWPLARLQKLYNWLVVLTKMSMIEMFVVAIFVAAFKFEVLVRVELQVGVYCMLASVLASMWVSLQLHAILRAPSEENSNSIVD